MTILYITDAFTLHGGIERVLAAKMNYLSGMDKYRVVFVTLSQGNNAPVFPLSDNIIREDLGINTYDQYHYGYPRRLLIKWQKSQLFKRKIREMESKYRPDIIVSYTTAYAMALLSCGLKAKLIMESHCARHRTGKDDGDKHGIVAGLFQRLHRHRSLKLVEEKATVVVALTEGDKKEWHRARRTVLIPNLTSFLPRHDYSADSHTIIAVGSLCYQKGYDMLLNAWKKVHNIHNGWHLDIYGDGPMRNEVESLIRDNGLEEAVTLRMPTNMIQERMAECSFLVLPSRYEGFGLVLTEAMMAGIPCVSMNCKYGPSEIIHNNEDGLLARENDTDDFASKILWMIEHPEERKSMAQRAYDNVQRYTPQRIMPLWEKLFNDIR